MSNAGALSYRTLAGVLVVAGLGIGAYLGSMFSNGFGTGQGFNGLGNPVSQGSDSSETEPTETEEDSEPKQEPESTANQGGLPAEKVRVVYVLIDGHDYLLRKGPEGEAAYKPALIEEVVAAASEASGDENGIRIRIGRRSSARESAERVLQKKLDEGGITADAIRWKDDPVPDNSTE